jgi:hypothetical protein
MARKDPVYHEVIRLLVAITEAATSSDFKTAMSKIGIEIPVSPSGEHIIAGFSKAVMKVAKAGGGDLTDIGDMARLSAISQLGKLFAQPVPQYQTELDFPCRKAAPGKMQRLLAAADKPEKFADLARETVAGMTMRIYKYYTDRIWPEVLGRAGGLKSIPDMVTFEKGLETHCRESSRIMHSLLRDWRGARYGGKGMSIEKLGSFLLEKNRRELHIRSGNK